MKRIQLPRGNNGLIFSSLPAASHSVILCDQWLKSAKRILLVVGSSLNETENLAEDVAKLLEIQVQTEDENLEFHLLEQDPAESHPDFFEKNCNKLSLLSSLMSLESSQGKRMIIAATPETLLSACTPRENKEKQEVSISCGMEMNFEAFQDKLSKDLDYSSLRPKEPLKPYKR